MTTHNPKKNPTRDKANVRVTLGDKPTTMLPALDELVAAAGPVEVEDEAAVLLSQPL